MFHALSTSKYPLRYISSGHLLSNDGFLHPRRNLDTHVLLLGLKGTMYITQGKTELELNPNTYIVLFAGMEHFGTRPSEGELSYLWCHFQIKQRNLRYLQTDEVVHLINNTSNESRDNMLLDAYILSEYGELSDHARVELCYHQLLDIANEKSYSHFVSDYALSLLVLEMSNQFFLFATRDSIERNKSKQRMSEIIAWLRTHHVEDCSLQQLAERFHYHPTYLSAAFRKNTGMTLARYVKRLRIDTAKGLLLNTDNTVAQVAWASGFSDDKTFMKAFKEYEFTTPSQYRYSFSRKRINKE